jgi:hypothetical protein
MAYDHAKVVKTLAKALFLAQHETCSQFDCATDYVHGAEYLLDAERLMQAEVNKSATIKDFLVNQFALNEDQYTKHELYAMLDHVTHLLDTKDGTLSPEQQVEIDAALNGA